MDNLVKSEPISYELFEPMDIDLSNSSASGLDIYNTPVKQEKFEDIPVANSLLSNGFVSNIKYEPSRSDTATCIKKYHIKIEKGNDIKTYFRARQLVALAVIMLVPIVCHHLINFKCHEEFDLKTLKLNLRKNLSGQARAIDNLIESLAMNVSSKILFLYGGTGVGKTYSTSLTFGDSWNLANVYHYTMPTFVNTFSSDFMLGLTLCKTSVIVVDDLKRDDKHIIEHIRNVIAKSEDLNKNITIILIYNCENISKEFIKRCDESFELELRQTFENVNALKKFIKFEPLLEEHLKLCIQRELGNREVSEYTMKNILKNFDVTLDGCKGVSKKVKSLNYV